MPRKPVLPPLLLETLRKHHLVSATQLQEILQEKGKSFNKTSIYRSLEKLIEQNKVCKQVLDGTEAVYEVRDHHHDHAICTSCDKIIEIPCLVGRRVSVKNFQVDHHHISVYGVCSICKRK